ncbi:hypothetical protein ACI65C_013470 [Semiaphis heraclei]
MGTKNDEDREFWCEFFLLYQELPELWKVKSEVYKNRNKKDAAYDKMVEKMKEIEPKADRAMVRTKINAFRTSYRRELKKVKSSIRSGAGTDDIYKPNLWYYNELDFLRDQEGQTQGTSTMDDNEIAEEIDQMNETVDGDSDFPRPSEQQSTSKQKLANKRNTTENEETKRAKLLNMACNTLQKPKSEFQIIASGWGIELSKMTPNQQLYAKKFIDDILFEGRLGNLHRHSVSINHLPSPLNPQSTLYNHQYP